uniref:Dystonin n=1 Tax=Cyprinus carpio TaxID=7962 RepID=A0A8C2BB84_CYPCA
MYFFLMYIFLLNIICIFLSLLTLFQVRKHINDLYEDLRDGHNLISLLEVLSGDKLPREKGRMRFHRLQNVQIALDYLKRRQVRPMFLTKTCLLSCLQISDIHVTGESEDMTAKERLLLWSRQMTEGYVGVRCDNFTTSWRDGRLFSAIIHKYRPDLVDMSRVSTQSSRSNLEQAFGVAEQLGVARLLDPEDVDVSSPDEKSVITYVSTLYDVFPKVPEGMEGISANDVDIKWVEYQNMVKYLSQWIKHNVTIMSDRNFPSNLVELKALYTQYLQFKENEIPPKENEKAKIKHLYKMLEVWIEFGRIQLPQGYHPNDVEKEWGKLIVAMLEREKSLRPEVDRLEMLQQIANRVQRDCVAGEDKLLLARTALQLDAKRLESGIQFQNEPEIAGYLLECENLLRQQVVDIQLLLDGKFYLADQLVQRVSKLRDDLLALRTECSTVYSQGRTLTSEQTKMMISGITQSLNSNFSPNFSAGLSPALTHGGLVTSGGSPAMSPAMTPSMQPASVQTYLSGRGGGGGGMEPGGLQQLKHMQIRKPMLKSSFLDPNLTEDEVNMKFVQDLINWVEEMQVQLDQAEWGSDLPSVESNLGNHRDFHKAIEEFQMSIKEARMSEIQMTQPLKQSYSEKLKKLESQYGRLLKCSSERQKHLDSLYDFVSRATQELIWLNEKEEEEVAFDWSERNSNISRKRDYHADLMRELDDKEEVIKSVQEKAESLLLENHPARLTIEAYRAAMQTQWSWILQLCHCVEQHLKENAVYFDFFSSAKESLDYLKSLQDAIHRKYSCDRSSSLHRLEDLVQESMDEKEQLLKYSSTVGGIVGRTKSVVQLKARNPENPIRTSIPVKAICDYRQIEITINKEDECILVSNSHRAKWKVISPCGNEAMVPSVCFSVPPPNKEATEMASRIEQLYQNVLALWHHSHINMKSVVSWHYLMTDIRAIRKSTVASIKTLLPGDHEQVLSSLESHFEDFLRDSDESEVFTVADCAQLEKEVLACKEYYEELLKSAEREEHEESVYNLFISEVRNFRMRVEGHEEQLIRKIRTPLDRDDLQECVLRITEQEKVELDRLKDDLETLREKCEVFLRQAAASPSVPTLSSELNILTQSTNQVYSMCCIYLEKLKTVSLVVKHSQSAEALVKLYEAKLCEEDTINANIKSIDGVMSTLKQWRSEIDERREVFHDLEDELQKARVVSERMFKTHNERDFDLDWHKEKADQLKERWQNIQSQIENRLRDLEGISKSLKYYKDTYNSLDEWSKEMEAKQLKAQENQPEDSKALAEFLNQQKVLVAEIEQKQSKIEECQKYSEQYAVGVKDYELQLMTYRAMVDSQQKSPVKRRKMQSSSDVIQQEFMDLRTRYTALVTLMTQYVKFAGETLKRAEEDERSVEDEKKEHGDKVNKLLNWMSSMKTNLNKDGKAQSDGKPSTDSTSKPQVNKSNYLIFFFQQVFSFGSYRLKEKQEAKEQLKSLNQAYSELSQHCADAASSADQLITTGLIWPEQHLYMDLEDAFKNKLVDDAMCKQLQELNEAKKCLQNLQFALEPLPVITALENGAISEQTAMKIIEIQLATGGLRPPYTGDILHLERAFQLGLIPESLFIQILERKDSWKNLIDPNTAEKVTLSQLMQRSIEHKLTGLRLLPVKQTMFRLLSTQLFAGGIVDKTGRKLTVDEAVQCDLISSSSALLVLEKQKAFMGLLWPNAGEILSFSTSLQQNIITDKLASELLQNRHKITALYIPETSEVVDIDSAGEDNLIETFTKELLKTIEIPDVFPDIDELNNRFSSWLVMKELQIDGSCSIGEEISDENSTDAPSPSEAKQLFISYLMMNSYMDPKSGQRLLIFDWQLNKMAKLLFTETSESEHVDETSGLHMKVSEESQLNNYISDNDNACLNADYSALGELQICEPLECTTEKEHGVVNSTELHNCPKPTLPSESDINTIETNRKCDVFLDCVEHVTVIETNKLSKDSTCSYTDKCQAETSNIASPQPSEAMQLPQTTFSVEATASSLCSMEVNPECHDANKDQEKHLKDSTLLSSETISYTEMPSEFPHTEVVWDDKLESDYAIHLLKAQVEEGGILDVTSGKRYDLEAALGKGLTDEETVLEVLTLQLQEDGLKENENATLSDLNISVSKSCISSKVALQIMEKQNLLGGFYDAAAGKTTSVCDALETALITDDLSRSVLSAEAIRKAINDPDGKCVLSVNDANQSGMLDDEEAERMLHSQTDEREDNMVPDLAKRGQISLRANEATQVSTDIECVSSSQGSLLPAITDTPFKGISTKDDVFDKVTETNGIGEDCDEQCASFKTIDFKNHIDTTDERERGFTLQGNETERPHNSMDTFDVDDSCKTVSPSPCVRQVAYLETTASKVVSPVQSDSGISCSSQSDICSEERKSERVPNPEQEFDRSEVESETNAYFDKRPSEGLSTSLAMVEDLAQVRTPAEPQSNSSLCCINATIAEVNLSTDDQHTLAQNMLNEKEEVSSQTNASYKAKYSNNVSENLDDEHSVQDSGVFSSENRVKDMVKYENRNAPETEFEPSAVCAESRIDCKVEKNDDIENSVGFKGSEDICQLNMMDLVGSTVNSEQLPLEIVTNSSQDDSSGGNHNIQQPSDQGIFCNHVAPKTTTKDELARSSESDLTSDNDTHMYVLYEGVSIMVYFLQRYSTQNYLECVGRLQDHCDTLEDIRSDLQTKGPLAGDIEGLHCQLEEVQDIEKDLSGTRQLLEDAAFDIQNFISEHAQFLSPTHSRHLLRALSTTQRSFKELMDRVFTQRQTLEVQLEICEDENQQQKQREFSEKLQELSDDLTQTENRLIGHQQQAASAETVGDLQQYQQEHQALQKDLQANVSALNEVISSTEKFLEENRSKLTPEQISALENKLEELKSKANMLNQKSEESRKDLEKVLSSAIQQETEKEAAVEQLEESKTKIEGLLDWISNIGKEKEMGGIQKDQLVKQNGNMPEYTSMEGIIGEEDDPNGNALDTTDNTSLHAGEKQDGKDLDLDQQFNSVKDRHQEILSQQQDLIIATQSAQALLDKQAQVLSPAEKDKLQRDIKELKARYEASLTQAEQQMKQVQTVQEELQKFKGDCEEFETWLQQAHGEMEELGAPAAGLDTLSNNLQRQKSFSEDVISHKGDLRFITISGQKVLDAAKACDHSESDGPPMVDMSGTCAAVKERLDSAASRYKALHTQCNQLGNNLKDVVEKYKKYEDASGALVKWLNVSEEESRRQQSEPIAGDPQTLQRQLEETKSLQGQTTSRQAAVDTLRKTADALISAEGDLLSHPEEIQETVDDIVERYDNLSKSASDRNEKLQVTLTRSLSVQDGLDEMMSWMEKVEESVKEMPKVLLDSSSIADALSKEAALEQDLSSRQSSILAMQAKVKKFVESAEPAAAAVLQTKMESLSQRFTDASERHKQKVAQMEELRDKVEQFEKTSEEVQQFVLKSSQALSESDGPGKNIAELSQLLQDTNEELAEHTKSLETLQKLTEELSKLGPEGSAALLQSKMQNISDSFNSFKETITERKEEVSSCQKQLQEFKAAAGVLMKWLEDTKEQVPVLRPNCSEQGLGTDLQKVNGLLDEWTSKAPAVQDINSQGSALCSLISVLTSPTKAKIHHNSGVSNGSGPGSRSYLTNQELMLVQQNMSSINNDYEHLGEHLKARSSELSALLKRVQGVHDQAETLCQWMEDTKKTATSLSNHPSGKDAVRSQIEQQKVFEDNMKQKQVQLQQLRENLLRLIEEHPDSPEAEKWKHMLAQIDAGWEEVKGTLETRKQHLEESSRMLELFQTSQPQLSQWLQEKELMMGVLGPLSVDPNMLNTQKQQVEILLKEFESRKPQYEKLTEAATAIASASEQQDPAVEQVKEQLASVSQKWQALTGQLSQRHALIEQVVGKTTQFQELLRSLSKSATCLETELNNQQALSTQPDEVKKQIEATNAILAQLREEKKRLTEAESVCSELSAMVTEEYLRADLTKQLEGITKPFRQLEDKAGKRIEQLNSAFASSQQFHQTSKDFQAWLNQTLQEQCKPQPISANAEKLKQSLKENSAVQKAISEHEELYNTIIKEGEALLQSTEGAEKVALQGQLSALRSNWDDVKKSNAAQAEKLQGGLQRALKYKEHSEKLSSWLQECEDREKNVKLSVNSVEIEGSLLQLKAIQKDVDKHRGQVVMMNTAADSLLEVVTSDGDSVREEKATIGKRADKLTEDLTLKKESLENISQKLKEFNDLQKEAKGQLEAARKQLDSHSDLGVQAYSSKNLTNMKAQQNSLEGVHNQVEHLKNVAKSLVVDASDVEGVTDLLLQADSLEKDHMSITKKVEDACSTLENKLQGIGQFQNSIREMFANFTDLDDEFDGMAPVGRDLDTLRDQQSTIKEFVARLQDLMTNTANGRDRCKKMLESEASPDLLGLKRDLETLGKQCGKLMDRAMGRRELVEETLSHLEEFYSKTQEFTHKLSSAEKQEESQGSVGLETEVINQQLEVFKVFQRDVIESLQSQIQELNTLGQALIQNAAKGTSTKKLDQDLEEVNTRWNTINKKVSERSAQLHEALLHCGRFQDALESLLSWLTDTEELVANQKPSSAEFKVVKAQIQEQKLLQRLLDDRRATVELIKTEGRKVTDLADAVDKEKIAREIECLGQRWDDLLKKAENRQKQLENILVVAQQFHETLEPLTEWLTATEKRLANSEPIGTQTSKLEEQISQHKALEEEVLGRGKILYQAMSLGQSLRTVSCVDDKELVQAKLDTTHSSYIELQQHCRQKAELLQQALANAQLFGEDEVALMTWLDEVHGKLSEVSIQDYTTAVLAKQHAEQLALHEDIELRKQNIEQAILNGLELLKQTTGDEVFVIQGKLDGIKTRYSEINTMSNNVSKTLDKAQSLATKLQNTHEELNSWLEEVESELAMFKAQEPVGEQLTCLQERQKTLMKEVKDQKPLVDSLNEVSSALLELVPWRAREGLDRMVTDDNERYRAASDAITQHVDQTGAAILKSQQFEQAATSELEWLTEAERKLSCLGDIRLEPEQTTAQLQAQKSFSMDIMRHKDAVDGIVKTGEAIMNNKDEAEKQALRMKLQALSEKYSVVSQLNSERSLQLERAHSLACQFWETHDELWPWLQETRTTFTQLSLPTIEYEALRQQQEELRQMRELIAEHKPHIDKMNKTGPQLVELSPTEGAPIREKYEAADKLYSQLKVDVKHRAAALDEAISKSTQFHDKIYPMLESLERIAERLRQPPSISVEVEKIREQISENKAVNVDLEKLQPSYETLKQRGEEMIARSEGADKDLSAKAVQDKLDQMVFLWNDIQALLEEREAKLLDVMDLAEKFWCDHCALIVTIKDTHDLLKELEDPGVDPSVVKQQQESVEGFREEIDGLQEELNVVQNLGAELMTACGEPDKPVIKKSIDEVNSAWETLNKAWKERVETLEEAMQAAVQFQDSLQNMFDSVDIMEGKLDSMSPVGTDLETVKQQIEELKEFKGDAYQLQIEMERLNHQAGLLLKKVLEEAERTSILEPMNELKMLWDNLDKKIINRQHKLEGALLALGQFQHALDELLAWLSHTEELLGEQRKACGDPKAIEIELAKHHVLQNDVLAHKTTVEAVNKAGSDLIDSSAGEEARGLQTKLENLNQRWRTILEKTEQRRQLLDSALLQAQGFHGEIEDMQQWLKDTERQLLPSKALGGLPDTAREQLNTHLELCSTLEAKEEIYKQLLDRGQHILTLTPEGQDSTTELDLRNLQEKWECVQTKVTERKVKLEEALTLATDFHNSLQDFINWLTQAEQTLAMASPASLILETIMFQIDEHKVFVTEVNSHRDQIIELDKTGTHLKYFSQKQDVVLIKNLLLSVQGRWEKVVQRSVERGRLLDDARKRAKQFHESWNKLMEWLEESERALDSELEIANDPDKIKTQLTQHKEFQKALGSKHSVYDTSSRTGRALKDKTSLKDDNQKLDDMLSELRDKWDTVCGKSVERQNKLEEALLFSGQFTDALQALIDWLYKVEPQLAEDQPVHGDIDLVLNLIDSHKVFQKELGKRTGSVQALKRSARELIENSHDDSSWVKVQMQELSTRWETVCSLSVSKQTRLEQALCQAEEFHSTVHILLEWLAEAEQSLRFHGALPDDEEALRALIEQHKEFMKKLEEKRLALNKATSMGEAILSICHPDSITTIKHWNTIIKARFEEVTAWARQHQQRLSSALAELLSTQDLLENLLSWLQWAETTLGEKDKEPLPQELEEVKTLIAEHQAFMEEMTRKQPDVDKITKTHKRKATADPPVQSQIPVLGKGRTARKRSPTQSMYTAASQAQIETKNPRVNLLVSKWQQVWLLALDRRRKLNDALDRLEELKEFANFDFDVWRKRYMRWMNHKKSRVMDFFRRIDKDQDGKVTRQEFIDGILSSKFPTSRLEMSAVADIFDRDGDGYIDYYEFVAALHPNKDAYKPLTDADKIEDEVTRQVAKCKCPKRFQVEQIGANKYRFYLGNQFGDSQQLRLVRILRSTVMVRVGGGWMALDEFLVKNDPCRAKGRTNVELREKFILPEGTTQVMASFRYRGRRSRPSSRGTSPNRSNSSHSCPAQPNPPGSNTPKTLQHLTRNYDKPWLTNSKSATPLKSSDSFDSQGSSNEGTPIQGSKLRLPGYLSGKGFQSGEDGSLINAAVMKARGQAMGLSKIPSSKAGSRGSSRRGSDASDFDISDIQSVCSDVSETVTDSGRPTPRSASRQHGGKPSKIPTPQRRSTPTSKLAKTTKR